MSSSPPLVVVAVSLFFLLQVSKEEAFCTVPEDLQAKYSVPPNGSQTIFEVRNKMSLETMVYNSERGRKPQTFKEDFSADTLIEAANYLDSSRGDMNRCDFCRHEPSDHCSSS